MPRGFVSPSSGKPSFQVLGSRVRPRHNVGSSSRALPHVPQVLLGLLQQLQRKLMAFAKHPGTCEGIADTALNRLKICKNLLLPHLLSSRNDPFAVPVVSHLDTASAQLHWD